MSSFIFIQLLPIIGVAVFALSFHAKSRSKILTIQAISLFVLVTHYLFLSAWTGAILSATNIVITFLLLVKDRSGFIKSRFFPVLAISILFILTALSWNGYYAVFAFLGLSSITIAKWQDRVQKLRSVAILASLCWIAYDWSVGSYGGIISELIIVFSIIFSIKKNSQNIISQ